jgi:hypothetical protein
MGIRKSLANGTVSSTLNGNKLEVELKCMHCLHRKKNEAADNLQVQIM